MRQTLSHAILVPHLGGAHDPLPDGDEVGVCLGSVFHSPCASGRCALLSDSSDHQVAYQYRPFASALARWNHRSDVTKFAQGKDDAATSSREHGTPISSGDTQSAHTNTDTHRSMPDVCMRECTQQGGAPQEIASTLRILAAPAWWHPQGVLHPLSIPCPHRAWSCRRPLSLLRSSRYRRHCSTSRACEAEPSAPFQAS